jgi:hypothetical protein
MREFRALLARIKEIDPDYATKTLSKMAKKSEVQALKKEEKSE